MLPVGSIGSNETFGGTHILDRIMIYAYRTVV